MVVVLGVALSAAAQQEEKEKQAQPGDKPQVKLTYLNVCAPSADEQEIIKTALSRVPEKPLFADDFERTRGRTTMKDAAASRFVRLRRDFVSASPMMVAQYSLATDQENIIEILVLRTRDPKEFLEVTFEDRVSAGAAAPATMLATDTPVARVRVERLGKSSVVLARCAADQSAYEAFFRQASDIMARYRRALGLRSRFRLDLTWLAESKPAAPGRAGKKSPKQ